MISREDFIFTIGYEGTTAIVDGKARRQYGKLSTMELAGKGLWRAAFSSALWGATGAPAVAAPVAGVAGTPTVGTPTVGTPTVGKGDAAMAEFIGCFNAKAGTSYTRSEELSRLFGVEIEEVKKVVRL